MAGYTSTVYIFFNLIAVMFYLHCSTGFAQAQSGTAPSVNFTELGSNSIDQLSLTCKIVEQTDLLSTINITNFSDQKLIQLQALNITGAQVKENICVWMTTVFRIDVLEGGSCSETGLAEVCNSVKAHTEM